MPWRPNVFQHLTGEVVPVPPAVALGRAVGLLEDGDGRRGRARAGYRRRERERRQPRRLVSAVLSSSVPPPLSFSSAGKGVERPGARRQQRGHAQPRAREDGERQRGHLPSRPPQLAGAELGASGERDGGEGRRVQKAEARKVPARE